MWLETGFFTGTNSSILRREKVKRMQYYAGRAFALAFFLFLIIFTLFVLGTGIPEDTGFTPSAVEGAKFIQEESNISIEMEPMYLSYQPKE